MVLGTHYVLIDYENVQPDNLARLQDPAYRVKVFIGDKQAKISFELAAAMQALGERAEYIKIDGNGLNALDFHIAFYVGQLAALNTSCQFHIISKDTGFDPLIRHLHSKRISIERRAELAALPILNNPRAPSALSKATPAPNKPPPAKPSPTANPVAATIAYLQNGANPRPKTRTSLVNFLDAHLKKQFDHTALNTLVEDLITRKIVVDEGGKISYPPHSTSQKGA